MPRKTSGLSVAFVGHLPASMRPRPDAAENRQRRIHLEPEGSASMRPRPDAAENQRAGSGGGGHARASMRPRPDAAENRRDPGPRRRGPAAASMRPRPDAAENTPGWSMIGPAGMLQ